MEDDDDDKPRDGRDRDGDRGLIGLEFRGVIVPGVDGVEERGRCDEDDALEVCRDSCPWERGGGLGVSGGLGMSLSDRVGVDGCDWLDPSSILMGCDLVVRCLEAEGTRIARGDSRLTGV